MRRNRGKQQYKRPEFRLCHAARLVKFIDQTHHGGDRGIEFQRLEIAAHLFYGLMQLRLQSRAVRIALRQHILELPHAIQEPAAALHSLLRPSRAQLERADKHFVGPKRIRAELVYNIVRINDIAAGFAHLLAVLPENHAVGGALLIRLFRRYKPLVIEEFVPETGIQKMQRRMLHAAVVPVNRQPVFQRLPAGKRLVVFRINVAEKIP